MLNFCWSTERKRTGLKKGQLCVNQWKALTVSLRTQKPITVNTTQTHPYKHTHKHLHFAVCSLRQFQADCYFQCFCRHCVWACLLLLRHAEQSKKAKTTQLSPHSGSIPLTFFHVEHFAPSITKQCVSGKKNCPIFFANLKPGGSDVHGSLAGNCSSRWLTWHVRIYVHCQPRQIAL